MGKWQPICTAPKDGTEILLRVNTPDGVPGNYLVGHYQPGGNCIDDHPPIDRGWYFFNGTQFNLASNPTHWMPLPKDETIDIMYGLVESWRDSASMHREPSDPTSDAVAEVYEECAEDLRVELDKIFGSHKDVEF